jgi:hypothetical protein
VTEPSIEQAALARAAGNDWQARARREATAIITEALPGVSALSDYSTLVGLVAIGWLQGVNYGSHVTLSHAEAAFDRLRADL